MGEKCCKFIPLCAPVWYKKCEIFLKCCLVFQLIESCLWTGTPDWCKTERERETKGQAGHSGYISWNPVMTGHDGSCGFSQTSRLVNKERRLQRGLNIFLVLFCDRATNGAWVYHYISLYKYQIYRNITSNISLCQSRLVPQ